MAESPVAIVCVGMAGETPWLLDLVRIETELIVIFRVWKDYFHAKNQLTFTYQEESALCY